MLIDLPILWIILLDIAAWFFFHMSISLLCMKISDEWFAKPHSLFQPFAWEKQGAIWQRLFRIKKWKKYLPDGSSIVKSAYNKTYLHGKDNQTLAKFIIETRRAELTHWLLIPPAFVFFIWNPLWAGVVMLIYAGVANLPFIIVQRYNRPRLERIQQRKLPPKVSE